MYNCSGPEFSRLRQIFAMLRLRMRPVGPERYHLTLRELANGEGEASEQAEEPIPEAMLVFCGLGDALLHQVAPEQHFQEIGFPAPPDSRDDLHHSIPAVCDQLLQIAVSLDLHNVASSY